MKIGGTFTLVNRSYVSKLCEPRARQHFDEEFSSERSEGGPVQEMNIVMSDDDLQLVSRS